MPDRARHDVNLDSSLIVVSNADGETPVSLWADPTTHALVTSGSGGGAGTQYASGAARGTATGTLAMVDDGTNIRSAKGDTDGTQQTNVTKLGGTVIDTNSGNKSAGTQRFVLATDQPNLTTPLNVNVSQMAGTTPSSGNGTTDSGTQRVTISSDSTGQVNLTDGTNKANILKSDGTVAGENAQLVAPGVRTLTFTTSTPGAQIILPNTDVSHYAWIEVVYTSVGSGLALTGVFSTVSGGTYVNQSTWASGTGSSNGGLGTANSTVYTSPVRGNFFQISVSALTSGTFTGTVTLRTVAPPLITVLASSSQTGTWTVQPGNTANSTAWLFAGGKTNNNAAPGATNIGVLPGVANAASPTWTEGNQVATSTDLAGNTRVVQYAVTSTLTNVASSATSVSLLASNAAAKSRIIFNESTQILYLKFGTTASATSYTTQIPANTLFEFPLPTYTGAVDGIWASANGNARITEVA